MSTFRKKLALLEEERSKLNIDESELEYVLVEISDTGEGIPKDNLGKIFKPFFTTKTEGVGLGLSICNRLVNENGGKIDVASEVGQGTKFVLALPTFLHH